MADEVRSIGDELIGREVELTHELWIVPAHGEVELVDAIRQLLSVEVRCITGPAHHQAREEHGLFSLRRLDNASQDIDIARFQALLALIPGARYEDDLAPCIAAERLHEVRLDAVQIARSILCDIRAELMDSHAQQRPRFCTHRHEQEAEAAE